MGSVDVERLSEPYHRWTRMWRRPNERFPGACIAKHNHDGCGLVMVSVGISLQSKTDLHIIDNRTLTAEYYTEILNVNDSPYATTVGPDFALMEDCA